MKDDSILKLTEKVKDFCSERDWDQYHNPKDLAIGISTEANELLDHFRFKSEEEMVKLFNNPAKKEQIGEELADVLFFSLRFAQMNNLDIVEILEDKISKNGKKYPVDKAKGLNLKYDEL